MTKSTDDEIRWIDLLEAECEMIASVNEEAAGLWRFWHLIGPPTSVTNLDPKKLGQSRFVSRRFIWSKTPQGQDYWSVISHKLGMRYGDSYSAKKYLEEKENEAERD